MIASRISLALACVLFGTQVAANEAAKHARAVRFFVPEGATRFAGYFRIVNEGAVRL